MKEVVENYIRTGAAFARIVVISASQLPSITYAPLPAGRNKLSPF